MSKMTVRRNMKTRATKQKGFTLIELMAVIVGGGFLIFIGMQSWPLARDFVNEMRLNKQIATFAAVVEKSCVNGDCSNVTTARVLASGNLREYHNGDNTAVVSITGVAVEFGPANIGAGTNNGLSQIHENINQRICSGSVKSVWPQASIIRVDGVDVKANQDATVDEDVINANCTTGMNQIEYVMAAS